MFTPKNFRSFSSALALASLLLSAAPLGAITVATPSALDLRHVQTKPYNFTGRTFIFSNTVGGFGSATAIRRHTALTAAHVVYDPIVGFVTRQAFNRGLLEDYSFQRFPVTAVGALTGYSTLASDATVDFFDASERDLGYLLYVTPPNDEDWADTIVDVSSLNDPLVSTVTRALGTAPAGADGLFVLGYPGETFDGATQAYIVPAQAFVDLGDGEFENDGYLAEEGMSGGPIYSVHATGTDATGAMTFSRQVVAETVGGGTFAGGSASASVAVVRAVDAEAAQLLASAEYANGLIKKVKVKGPLLVTKGSTVTYTTTPKFAVPSREVGVAPARPTTTRYAELSLVSDTLGTPTNPAVTIVKTSNTTFQVKFSSTLRSRSQITLTVNSAPNAPVAKSSIVVQIQ